MDDFRPLAGVRVLDFSHVVAGPLATFYLARLGAEVLKVEHRHGGDIMRRGKGLASFVALNAGKTGLALDLADPADRAQALALAGQADVLLDSLRPGVLERHGLGEAALRSAHPRLIYCAISGFGRTGEWAQRPAYDHVVQAATGMALMAGREGDPPIKTGFPVIDAATGIVAALAVLAALRERDATGRGRLLDVSMCGAALQLMYPFACEALTHGSSPPRVGNQGYSGSPAADFFATCDGGIAIGANTPRQLLALLDVLDLGTLAHDPQVFDAPPDPDAPAAFLRARDPGRLRERLARAIAAWPADALEAACAVARVPAARVRALGEFTREAVAAGALAPVALAQDGVEVCSPGLGFRVV